MNILIIIYDFPPYMNGGSVIRTIKYIKYLKNRDINFSVVTVKRKYLEEKENFKDIINDISVYYLDDPIRNLFDKVKGNVSQSQQKSSPVSLILNLLKYIVKWGLNNLLFPDIGYFWYRKGFVFGNRLIQKSSFDVIYSSFPEPSAHWLGFRLAKKNNLPLVLDYRDLWSTNLLFKKNTLMNLYLKKQEKRIINYSKAVIFTTELAMEQYINRKYVNRDKAHLIWNGYDPKDYSVKSDLKTNYIDISLLNFTYTGGTGNLLELRRTPKPLMDAFKKLHQHYKHIKLNFFGDLPDDVINYAKEIQSISISPAVKHSFIPQILNDSDVLILILTKVEDLTAVPGKLYEYIFSKKYILALTEEESQVNILLKQYKFGTIAKPDNKEEIYSKMKEIIDDKLYKKTISINEMFIEKFNRAYSSEKLYQILKKLDS